MLKCGCLVEWWVYDDGDSGWGGRILQSLHVFPSFSDYLLSVCALILLSARTISLWGAAATGPGMYQGTGFTGLVCGTQSVISIIVQQ